MNYFLFYKEKIVNLLSNSKIEKCYMFGSILNDKFNYKSDIDLIFVTNQNISYLFNIALQLEKTTKRKIHFTTPEIIDTLPKKHLIKNTKVLIYDSTNSNI